MARKPITVEQLQARVQVFEDIEVFLNGYCDPDKKVMDAVAYSLKFLKRHRRMLEKDISRKQELRGQSDDRATE